MGGVLRMGYQDEEMIEEAAHDFGGQDFGHKEKLKQEMVMQTKQWSNMADQAYSEVVLFVDNREKRNQQDGNYLFDRLCKNGLTTELKNLPLGDFLWVLRVYNEPAKESEAV